MKRTTHRSSKGTKLYAVRDKRGKFKDIQTYKRAHRADLRLQHTKSDRKRIEKLDEQIIMLTGRVVALTEIIRGMNKKMKEYGII